MHVEHIQPNYRRSKRQIRHSKSNNESQTSYVEDSARALSLDTHLTYSIATSTSNLSSYQFTQLVIKYAFMQSDQQHCASAQHQSQASHCASL